MKYTLLIFAMLTVFGIKAQQTGYYNGTSGKEGDELKASLHQIIKDHTVYSYHSSKYIFKLSDADPDVPGNVILVYTGRSESGDNFGTGGDFINREHVWAKSHGNFVDWLPMYSDVHNLKPADASVNVAKSNKDFDNGGIQDDEATGCYYTDSTWEARDEVKGDIARIIFYMSTRYEGGAGEIDLEVVDWNNTYPYAEHGKLSTLLQWNQMDPPDAFERNRNDVIESFQHNRNPFIDNPEYAQLIWGGEASNPIVIDDIDISPSIAVANEPVTVSAIVSSENTAITSVEIMWGTSQEMLTNAIPMTLTSDNNYTGNIPGQAEDATIYYKIVASTDIETNVSVVYNFYVPKIFTGDLVSIYDIQGQTEDSPFDGEIVSTTGIVTASFGTYYYLQNGTGLWNGLFIYESGRNPAIGDSIIVTGLITEYYNKTEMSDITDYYFISSNNQLPAPVEVATGDIEEGHESILIQVKNAVCTDENYQANYYMWEVNDGSGPLKIHNTTIFEYEPSLDLVYDITGPLNYDFSEWKVDLRNEDDITSSVDEDGPTLVSVEPVIPTNIKIMFNEEVDETTVEDLSNYSIDNGIVIESATQHAFNQSQVNLTISSLVSGVAYTLTVNNIQDLAGNVMEEQTENFTWVGIDELFEDGTLNFYPNPAQDKINLSFNLKKDTQINVMLSDISGKQLISEHLEAPMGQNQMSFDVSGFAKGIYVLNINTEKGTLNYKVVIK